MVVRMRANRSHRDNRRAHHALFGAHLSVCENCKKEKLSHRVCPNCGKYKGLKVIDVEKKLAKKEKKMKKAENSVR